MYHQLKYILALTLFFIQYIGYEHIYSFYTICSWKRATLLENKQVKSTRASSQTIRMTGQLILLILNLIPYKF